MNFIDDATVDVCCTCGAVVKVRIGQVRKNPAVTCPEGHKIAIDARDFEAEIRRADRSLDELLSAIREFGRSR